MIAKPSVLLFLVIVSGVRAQSAPEPESVRVPDGVPTLSTTHTLSIDRVLLSPDGRRVFTHDGGNVYAWDFESRKKLRPLSAGATSQKGTALRQFYLVTDQQRLVFGSNSANYETLEPFPSWPDVWFEASAWDSKRQKRFWARGSRDEIEFGELADGSPAARASRAHVIIKSKEVQPYRAACHSLSVLDDGRLLASTTHGIFFIDPDTWTISSPGREPERGARTLMYMDDTREVKTATFTHEEPSGGYQTGPPGTLIHSKSSSVAENRTEISIVSAKDLTVLRTTVMQGFPTYLGTDTFDPDKKQLWFKTRQSLIALDFDTLVPRDSVSVAKLATHQFEYVGDAIPVPGSTHWLIAVGKTLWLYNVATETPVGSFGEAVPSFNRIATHPTRFELLVTDQRGSNKRVRFLPSGLEVSTVKGSFDSFAFDPTDGETIAHGTSGSAIISFSDRQSWPKQVFRLPEKGAPGNHGAPQHVLYSADGTRIAAHSHYGVTVYDLTSGKTILNQPGSQKWIPPERPITAFSPDNKWLVAYDGEKKIIGYDCERGELAWEQSVDQYPVLIYFAGPKTVCTLVNGQIEYRSAETGVIKLSSPVAGLRFANATAVSPDRKLIAFGSYTLSVYDPETESVVFEAKTPGQVRAIAFFPHSPRYLITAGADNLLRLWDIQEKQELCSLALFNDNNDWVVTTKDLRFDGSENAIDKMYLVKGADVIPLESLFDQLYTPKLLASLLQGEKIDAPVVDLKKLVAPPIVRLESADGTRNLVVEDDDGGNERAHDALRLRALADARQSTVAEIRLFQNGKLLTTTAGRGVQFTETFDVKLVPGENTFRAVAFNTDRTESRPAEITFTYRPRSAAATANASTQQPSGLHLHLLLVGVNEYKNSKYNLNYAVADATAVKEKIEAQTQSIFTGVNVKFILNDQAQKSLITDAFRELSAKAGPRDVFVFYYAGHGVMTSDAKPEFFLVPHDVTQLYGADDALRQKGLSSAELLELSRLMPAQKQLFILDACQSAGALQTVAMRGAAEEKAIAQLARSSGTHWLTASGSEQFATEFATLGHGAFTYALIEGLSGRADTGDGRVTVNELKAFLESEVPELTQKHKGTPQYPSSYGFGQDFPVVIKTP